MFPDQQLEQLQHAGTVLLDRMEVNPPVGL